MDAEASCLDIELFFADPKLLNDPRSPRFLAFQPRAVEVAFQSTFGNETGKDLAAQLLNRMNKPTLDKKHIGPLSARIITVLGADPKKVTIIDEVLKQYENQGYAELQTECSRLQNHVKAMQPPLRNWSASRKRRTYTPR